MYFLKRFMLSVFFVCLAGLPAMAVAADHEGTVTIEFNLNAPPAAKNVRLWIPYPVSDDNQMVGNVKVSGNYSHSGVHREGKHGNMALYAEWDEPAKKRELTYSFTVKRKRIETGTLARKEPAYSRQEYARYLRATSLGPTTGTVRKTARTITKGKRTNHEKAKAIYDWIVKNMYRDPNIKGCGYGDVEKLLVSLGGKCGDIHSVFVALARSVDVPAREIFGLRLPKENKRNITSWQHCWAEFYMPGFGWVPVDPSDVRKVMLKKKTADLNDVQDLVEFYFGGIDQYRVAYQTGRDITLNPPQNDVTLNYFMYPYAEVDGKTLNADLFGHNLGYTISFKSL